MPRLRGWASRSQREVMMLRKLAGLTLGVFALILVFGTDARSADFSGTSFTCLQYTNGLGDQSTGRMQSNLARLWIHGYLAGYYKGQGKLEWSADPADAKVFDDLIALYCSSSPQSTILNMALLGIAKAPHKLPEVAFGDYAPSTYTCGQHLDAKNGTAAAANKADLAEMWAFAFIQGFKNVSQPDTQIGLENKSTVINVILGNKVCGANRDKPMMDYAAMVAEKVKMK